MTKVYVINVNNINIDETVIPSYCENNVNKYNLKSDRRNSLIGWSFLNKILIDNYNIDLDKNIIYMNLYGKPYIKNNIYFNISHCDNYVAIIVSEEECGIDIEKMDKNKCNDILAKNILTQEEYDLYLVNRDYEFFFESWVIKEAYYKKQGTGISLKNIKCNIQEVPYVHKFSYLDDKYVLSTFPKIDKNDIVFI